MDAQEFWSRLEFRVCREIDGLRRNDFRGLWCDGFLPDAIEFTKPSRRIGGTVWMGWGGSTQELWQFLLLLPQSIKSEADLDWASLLPANDVTGWLSLDKAPRFMKINPSAAYPDLEPSGVRATSGPRETQ